jgi:hypothetical protein
MDMRYGIIFRKLMKKKVADIRGSFRLYHSQANEGANANIYDNLDFTIQFQINLFHWKTVYVAG